jgi:head-tail adaptor
MSDAIGAMRARVRLVRPVRAADDLGGGGMSWSEEGDVWAAIEAAGAASGVTADTTAAITVYRLTINRHNAVRAGWRAIWGARLLRITGVRDEGGPRIVLHCEEEKL